MQYILFIYYFLNNGVKFFLKITFFMFIVIIYFFSLSIADRFHSYKIQDLKIYENSNSNFFNLKN